MKEVKSKIEALENQTKQMKETDTGKSVCFSDMFFYPDFEYSPKFQVPKFENFKGVDYL